MINSTNWSKIINEVGIEDVMRFAYGKTTARHFEGLSSSTRSLVRSVGSKDARELARRALRRRGHLVAPVH